MAKYYVNKDKYPVGTDHVYFSVSDNPDAATAERPLKYHPSATLTVRHYPSSATPRFDFTRDYDLPATVSKDIRQKVNKDIGISDADRVLEGRALSNYQFAAHAADRTVTAHRMAKDDGNPNVKDLARKEGIDYAKQVRNIRNQPNELFETDPGSATVVHATSHSRMRHTIPLMAAHAHQKFGELTASEDLSPHSSRMVHHAKKLNLPISTDAYNANAEVTNSMDFDDVDNRLFRGELSEHFERIPDEEMASAKKYYKNLRRAGKSQPTNMGPQFEQLRLPGMGQ